MPSGVPVLTADRTRLEDVAAEILGLERALNLLRTEKSDIQERLRAYRYPVLTLPNEIVSEIFVRFLPTYPHCPSMTGLFSPTLLTQICRKWRHISLTTPALWRAISFPLHTILAVHQLESWLERSCFCPLSVEIAYSSPPQAEAVFQTLVPHRLRWEYLTLDIYDHGKLHTNIEGPTPLLRELNLGLDEASPFPITLKEAPLLREVSLNGHAAAAVILPWAQLTSLTLYGVYPLECSPILLQACSLVHCTLNLIPDEDPIRPDVNLPSLESLILVDGLGYPDVEAMEYLGTFIVPALRKVQVPELYIGTDPVNGLTSFVAKSGCKLQEVYIAGRRRTSTDDLYREALPLIPKMTFEIPLDTRQGDLFDGSTST
ncbi:hypothetical protein C8R43DRAFT_297889 [Mycena crocata]|nr:hypothetical protein C8R43DRAFT_297889 [Mycena crocata]